MNTSGLQREARQRWDDGTFLETGMAAPAVEYGLPWVPYEAYMRAQLVRVTPGDIGLLLVDFPPESTEDNALHIHPVSDRVVTVIRGSGEFHGVIKNEKQVFTILPGYKVWMPRGVVHTFMAGKEGLLVQSVHNPFVGLDDPSCLIYP